MLSLDAQIPRCCHRKVCLQTHCPCPISETRSNSYGNSFPKALDRVSEISVSELSSGASAQDKEDAAAKVFSGDLQKADDVQAIFDYYNKEGSGIWGVIHIAALKAVGESAEKPIEYYSNNISATILLLDVSLGQRGSP